MYESLKVLKDSKNASLTATIKSGQAASTKAANINGVTSREMTASVESMDPQKLLEIYSRKKGRRPNIVKALI